jgi:hypothetical protein
MSTIVTATANAALDEEFGSGAPATWYIALYTALPADDGSGGTEVSGGSYARAAVTNNATNFPAASGRQKSNALAITFAQATANWGTVVGVGFFTASSGGTPVYKKALVTNRTVQTGDTFSFAATQLVLQVP